jgi:hypothetical protein
MSFDEVTAKLAGTFEGQATKQADTFAGKMARLNVAFSEAKETVGSYILTAITPLVSGLVNNVIPAVSEFASSLGEKLGPQFAAIATFVQEDLLPAFTAYWSFLVDEFIPAILNIVGPAIEGLFKAFEIIKKSLVENQDELKPFFNLLKAIWEFAQNYLAPILGTTLKIALQAVATVVTVLINGFSQLANFIGDAYRAIVQFVNFIKNNSLVSGIGNVIDGIFGGAKATGGPVSAGRSYLVGERGPELFMPSGSGNIIPNHSLSGGGTVINLTVNGALDAEGTARTIINVLNRSNARGALGANRLVFN